MQKERKSQARQNSDSLAIKQSQGSLGPPWRLEITSWITLFEWFCRHWNSHQLVEVKWHTVHKHVDPRLVGTRRLIMLIPHFLTTNQSKECPWADYTPHNFPSPHSVFKIFLWKPLGSSGFLSTSYLDSLLRVNNIRCIFLNHNLV